jgi:hypothetical protein
MTNEQRLKSLANVAIIMFSSMLLQNCVGLAALWHAGKWWEQARWTAAEVGFTSVLFFTAGLVNLIRLRKKAVQGAALNEA